MNDEMYEIIMDWAEGIFLNIPNDLMEEVKEMSKKKKTATRLFLVALIWNKLPEEFKKLVKPCEMSIVSLRSYKEHWKEIKKLTDKYPDTTKNYTKVKIETIIRLLNDDKIENSGVSPFLEMAKQNALYRGGNKRNPKNNYSAWTVYTKDFKKKLLNSLSETQIRASIKALAERGYIKAERVTLNKESKNLRYSYWKISTVDIKDLAIARKTKKDTPDSVWNNLAEKLKKPFKKYNYEISDSDISDLVTYFKETKDQHGQPWVSPVSVIAKDLMSEDRLRLQSFYNWQGDQMAIRSEQDKKDLKDLVQSGDYETLKDIARGMINE